jgi:hypothetical protein
MRVTGHETEKKKDEGAEAVQFEEMTEVRVRRAKHTWFISTQDSSSIRMTLNTQLIEIGDWKARS